MKHCLIATLALLLAAPAALRAEPQSVYTDVVLKHCKTLETFEDGMGASLKCRGYGGIDVAVVEGDLRFYVGYGADTENQCAMHQTFGPFNNLGPKIEWRLDNGKPYATILRWYLDNGEGNPQQSWLVVTRLDGLNTCHVAYIEGAMADANQRARAAADDSRTHSFDCYAETPLIVARPGTDTERLYPHACERP